MQTNPTFTVFSSNGELKVSRSTGEVVECNLTNLDDRHLKKIKRFGLDSFCEYYDCSRANIPNSVDILDIAYWYEEKGEEVLVKAEDDHRTGEMQKRITRELGGQVS